MADAAPKAEVLPPRPVMIPVDFCRGSAGPFLAINSVVVAGEAPGDGSSRVIQGFQITGADLVRALAVNSVAPAAPPAASDGAENE